MIPTVTSMTPAVVRTAGRTLVEVIGTGFQIYPVVPDDAELPVPAPKPTVSVLVDGVEATDVEVAKEDGTRLFFVTPPHERGPVNVVVRNIDDDGVPIPGETVTVTAALEYRRPDISHDSRSIVARITAEVLRLLRRDIMDNVRTVPSVDFDRFVGDGTNYINTSELPAVCIFGPDLRREWSRRLPSQTVVQDGSEYKRRRSTRSYDLVYRAIVVANKKGHIDNLKVAVTDWFQTVGTVEIDRDATDPAKGKAKWEIDLELEPKQIPTIANGLSDVRAFNATFAVLTVDLGDLYGFPDDAVRQRGGTLQEFNLGVRQSPVPDQDEEE